MIRSPLFLTLKITSTVSSTGNHVLLRRIAPQATVDPRAHLIPEHCPPDKGLGDVVREGLAARDKKGKKKPA